MVKGQYLSTSQAAKICNVTRHTIINWVNWGKIKSNKTVGGHRRILKEDLVRFIKDNKIVEIANKSASELMPRCWEFENFNKSDKHDCAHCLVFKRKANKCFLMVREFGSERRRCKHDCSACKYLKHYYPEEKKAFSKR